MTANTSQSPVQVSSLLDTRNSAEEVYPADSSTLDGETLVAPAAVTPDASKDDPSAASAAAEEALAEPDAISSGWSIDDPMFVLPKCTLPPPSELASMERFVEAAIHEQDLQPESAAPLPSYKGLLDALRWKSDPDAVWKILLALRTAGRGSTLHQLTGSSRKHARLVHQILRLNPFELPAPPPNSAAPQTPATSAFDLADSQLHLLLAVVSANTVFLVPTLTFAWKLLTTRFEDVPVERTQRCHAFLASLLRLCPKAKTELFPVISAHAPFRAKPEAELVWYYRQCLHVLRYHPGLQSPLLELLVDKCLEMDVEIKISDLGEVAIDTDNDHDEAIFDMELGAPADASPKEQPPPPVVPEVTVDEMASKLDALMLLLFQFLNRASQDRRSGDDPASILYDVLARAFESSILICHKSKFVQFLVFYLCGLEGRTPSLEGVPHTPPCVFFHRDFCSKLIGVLLDPYRATATRQSGACYLASFVSRASFVSSETVCEAVSALLRWAEAYLRCLDATPNPSLFSADDSREQCSLHSLFYTVCQSTFYIMCFRGAEALAFYRSAVETQSAEVLQCVDLGRDRWTRLCSHSTQPLRFCLESVRAEFLALSRAHNLMDVTVCDALDRSMASGSSSSPSGPSSTGRRRRPVSAIKTAATLENERRTGGVGGLGQGKNPLDSFFPFDPYLLRRSHTFVEPFYIHWCGVSGASGSCVAAPTAGDSGEDADAVSNSDDDESEDADDIDDDDENNDEPSDSDSESDGTDVNGDEEDRAKPDVSDLQPMSFVSFHEASISAATSGWSTTGLGSSDALDRHEALRAAWDDTLRRTRAASIENGSW